MTLQSLADATRVRRSYLVALEEMKLDQLPSRPFTIGYVRAAAQVLGLDPDDAVIRFKREAPDPAEPLRAPVGVSRERDPRLSLLAGGAAVVVCAVLVWNLAQHAMASDEAPSPAIPDRVATAAGTGAASAPPGAVVLSAPLPPPADSDIPPPYVTPGLEKDPAARAAAGMAPLDPMAEDTADPAQAGPLPPAPPKHRAAVFGAPAGQSTIQLRARKSASLVIRGPDGQVYFARQLAAGDTYRAPNTPGLTVDVSDPMAFDVYAAGAFKGQMPAPKAPLAKLAG